IAGSLGTEIKRDRRSQWIFAAQSDERFRLQNLYLLSIGAGLNLNHKRMCVVFRHAIDCLLNGGSVSAAVRRNHNAVAILLDRVCMKIICAGERLRPK